MFEEAEEGGYIAHLEEIPGVYTQGETLEEAKANLEDAFKLYVDTKRLLQEEELKGKSVIKEEFELA